jgi:hypothetical protein
VNEGHGKKWQGKFYRVTDDDPQSTRNHVQCKGKGKGLDGDSGELDNAGPNNQTALANPKRGSRQLESGLRKESRQGREVVTWAVATSVFWTLHDGWQRNW